MTDLIPNKYEALLRNLFLGIVQAEGPAVALQKWNDFFPGGPKQDQAALEELLNVKPGTLAVLYTGAPTPEPTPSPEPGPGPIETNDWRDKLRRPMCFADGPHYTAQNIPREQLRPWLAAIRDQGLTGFGYEMCGEDPIQEYITKQVTPHVNVAGVYDTAFDFLADVLPICAEFGLIINIKVTQANWSWPAKMTEQFWFNQGLRLARLTGGRNCIVMPVNETDSRTPDSVRAAIKAGLLEGGFPLSQMVGYLQKGDHGFLEHHPKSMDHLKDGDHTVINLPDNGDMIRYLYGDNWKQGGVANQQRIVLFTKKFKGLGTSGGDYSFGRQPSLPAIQAQGAGWHA